MWKKAAKRAAIAEKWRQRLVSAEKTVEVNPPNGHDWVLRMARQQMESRKPS